MMFKKDWNLCVLPLQHGNILELLLGISIFCVSLLDTVGFFFHHLGMLYKMNESAKII